MRKRPAQPAPNPTQEHARRIEQLRRWSYRMDRAFRIPGTQLRFGWDAIVGLVPGFGDAVMAAFSLFILSHSFRMRLPGVIRIRMLLNVLLDFLAGAIPVLGDFFDVVWKASTRNLALLERHGVAGEPPATADWVVALCTVAVMLAVLAIPVLILYVLARAVSGWFPDSLFRTLLLSL